MSYEKLRNAPRKLVRLAQRLTPPKPRHIEQQIYQAILEPGDVCFDVGANMGAVALFLALMVGEKGLVVAFEPIWISYLTLCNTIQKDGSLVRATIIPVHAGLAEASRTATMYLTPDRTGFASLALNPYLENHTHVLQYCRLMDADSFLVQYPTRTPNFLKIDVEGAEGLVLRGATKLLQAHPLMLIEMFGPWQQSFGYSSWDVLAILADAGYKFVFVCPDQLIQYEPSPTRPFPDAFVNGYDVIAYHSKIHRARIEKLLALQSGKLLRMGQAPYPNHPSVIR